MSSLNLLVGKQVLLTGGNRGLGKSILQLFAENGANLIVCNRSRSDEFDSFCDSLMKEYSINIRLECLDLEDEGSIDKLVKALLTEDLHLDVLVNNAGMPHGATALMTKRSELKRVYQVNYFSQIFLIQGLAKLMFRRRIGSIINVSSVSGLQANEGTLAYGGSKAAFIHSSKVLASEFAPFGVRVNAVAPGAIDTRMLTQMKSEAIEELVNKSNFDRAATPREIAEIVLFLASDLSSHISGEIISTSGGK